MWKGRWWLPEDPTTVHAGVLTYEPGTGLDLMLVGGFAAEVWHPSGEGSWVSRGEYRDFPVVHGVAGGLEITLFDVTPSSSRTYGLGFFREGPDEQTLDARFALVGIHAESQDQPAFDRAEVLIEDTWRWSGTSAIRAEIGWDQKEDRPSGKGDLHLSPVEDLSARIPEATVTLTHWLTLPRFDETREGLRGRMEHKPALRVTPDNPSSFRSLLKSVDMLQGLLALATGRDPALLWLRLREPLPEIPEGEQHHRLPKEVAVYLVRRGQPQPTASALEHREMLFSLEDIAFEDVIPRWWDVDSRFQAACSMLLGERYNPARYVEPRLIIAVAMAESFHGALKEQAPLTRDQALERLAPALAALDAPDAAWLKSFVPSGFSLRDRLERLAARIPPQARDALLPDPAQWARETKQARNGLSHAGSSQADINVLYAVVCVTRAVVVVNILLELGMTEEMLLKALRESRELSRACSLSKQYLSR